MLKKSAKELYETEFWKGLSYHEKVKFQLFEKRLCMPFSIFHEALEESLGRPVFTHEMGYNLEGIQKEFLNDDDPPSFEDIMNLIPEEKRVVVVVA